MTQKDLKDLKVLGRTSTDLEKWRTKKVTDRQTDKQIDKELERYLLKICIC